MKKKRKYRIIIEDESHLSTLAETRLSRSALAGVAAGVLAVCVSIAVIIIMFTPLRTLLPGYMNNSQRVATEDNLMRLDSLSEEYSTNQAYIDNCLKVLDENRVPSDSSAEAMLTRGLIPDSLTGASAIEAAFVSRMEEKERFNISVLAPLAADGMLFSPVSPDGIFTMDSRASDTGTVIVPEAEPVQSSADGSVVASYYSWAGRGYELVILHDRGFMTAYSHVGAPLVTTGDIVNSGQAVAMAPEPDRNGRREFSIRMWHDGLPVIPYEYVGTPSSGTIPEERFEAPRGR